MSCSFYDVLAISAASSDCADDVLEEGSSQVAALPAPSPVCDNLALALGPNKDNSNPIPNQIIKIDNNFYAVSGLSLFALDLAPDAEATQTLANCFSAGSLVFNHDAKIVGDVQQPED